MLSQITQKQIQIFEQIGKFSILDEENNLYRLNINKNMIQNDIKGFRYVQDAANKSHPKAQYTLGAIYYIGAGVVIDFNKAFKWISLSADQGYSDAQHNLAQMYEAGEGVSQNFEQAYKYYLKAARNDNLDSQIKVSKMYKKGIGTEKNLDKSTYWLKKIEESKARN